ncbi:MAG: hypothetical protein V3V00_10025 [Saprospiraceae bacterium]
MLIDQNEIKITSHEKDHYHFNIIDVKGTNILSIHLKKGIILDVECDCDERGLCAHIAAALIVLRKRETKRKTQKRATSNKDFTSKIRTEDLEHFILSRMKANKDFKTLIQARFLVEVYGVDLFENYLDKAFPPSRTSKITPAQKEVKLFNEVVAELYDQIKDLVGHENYIDASLILIPLIKKSFYFKNRFENIPIAFLNSHLLLVDILNAIHGIIEAPSLKTQNAYKMIDLMALSYVDLSHPPEKNIILNLLSEPNNKTYILSILNTQSYHPITKSYAIYLNALRHICGDNIPDIEKEIGSIFIEIYNWKLASNNHIDDLLNIAAEHKLPTRFIEKLLSIKLKDNDRKLKQIQIAIASIIKYRSYNIFRWVHLKAHKEWKIQRPVIFQKLIDAKDNHTLIKILIHESAVKELFELLIKISDVNIYNQYLPHYILLSKEKSLELYCQWVDKYLENHFGEIANKEIDRNLRIVGVIDVKFRNKIEHYVLKKFGERPSIKT